MSPPATQTVSPQTSFQQYLQDQAPSESFFLGNINIPTKLHELVNDIHKSCFAMASDGSVRSPNGSFSWVIYGMRSKQYLTGHNTLTGGHSDLSTFRTEACEYLGVLSALKAILTVFPLSPFSSHITSKLHIDNLVEVRRSQDTSFSTQQYLQPEWDIMCEAYNVRLILLVTITVLHVHSHQDNTTADPNSLSLPAHLNIVADSGIHQAYKNCPHFQQTPPLPSTQATLVLNRSRVTSKITTHASHAYYRPIMADYFYHKFDRDNITFSNIDWDSSEKEYQRLSLVCCLASFKLQNSLWPTNKTLHQRRQAPSPLCSWCNLHPETHSHILCCEQAQPIRLQQWLLVSSVLKTTLNTPLPIHDSLKLAYSPGKKESKTSNGPSHSPPAPTL